MATSNTTIIHRVSVNIQELLMINIAHTQMLKKETLAVRKKINVDISALIKGLSYNERLKLLNVLIGTIQVNLNTAGSTAKIAIHGDCLSMKDSNESGGIAYEDEGGLYGGLCGKGSINGLTGGGIFGGFSY